MFGLISGLMPWRYLTRLLQYALRMPFDRESGKFTNDLQSQSREVKAEIHLAGERATDRERRLQIVERNSAAESRRFGRLVHSKVELISDEDRAWRAQRQLRESQAQKQKLLDTSSTHAYYPL